jgi:hypothetical protein
VHGNNSFSVAAHLLCCMLSGICIPIHTVHEEIQDTKGVYDYMTMRLTVVFYFITAVIIKVLFVCYKLHCKEEAMSLM